MLTHRWQSPIKNFTLSILRAGTQVLSKTSSNHLKTPLNPLIQVWAAAPWRRASSTTNRPIKATWWAIAQVGCHDWTHMVKLVLACPLAPPVPEFHPSYLAELSADSMSLQASISSGRTLRTPASPRAPAPGRAQPCPPSRLTASPSSRRRTASRRRLFSRNRMTTSARRSLSR